MEEFYSKNNTNRFWKILLILIAFFPNLILSQSVPSSLGTTNCWDCVPNVGWTKVLGTPDVSDANNAASTANGGLWTERPLPLPPNGHTHWITIRDVGGAGAEEIVRTTITGLEIGKEYEVVVYSMAALTGTASGVYSRNYIDQFFFEIEGGTRVAIVGTAAAGNATSGTIGTANIREVYGDFNAAAYVPSANQKPEACNADTDGDGIPNHLDLDSDGDGCSDAVEGTRGFSTAQTTTASGTISSQVPNQNFGVAVNPATGVPTIVGTGQGTSFSQNAIIKACLDSDNDGILDIYDLDDDNDGILDTTECNGNAVAIYNYTGYGIQAVSTTQSDLYGFSGANSTPFLIASNIMSGGAANHLGTDAARNRVIFSTNGAQGGLFAYNFGSQTVQPLVQILFFLF